MSDGFVVVVVDGEVQYHDEEVTIDALYDQIALQAAQIVDLKQRIKTLEDREGGFRPKHGLPRKERLAYKRKMS